MLDTKRRLKAYWFSSDLIVELLRHGRVYGCEEGYDRLEIVQGIPAGAVIHAANYDMLQRAFIIVVEHESFPEVAEAIEIIPDRVIRWGDLTMGAISTGTFVKEPADA